MTAKELGGAMHDKAGSKRERELSDRRCERVVDHHDCALSMASGDEPRQIQHPEGRIGWRFEVQQARAAAAAAVLDRYDALTGTE